MGEAVADVGRVEAGEKILHIGSDARADTGAGVHEKIGVVGHGSYLREQTVIHAGGQGVHRAFSADLRVGGGEGKEAEGGDGGFFYHDGLWVEGHET